MYSYLNIVFYYKNTLEPNNILYLLIIKLYIRWHYLYNWSWEIIQDKVIGTTLLAHFAMSDFL